MTALKNIELTISKLTHKLNSYIELQENNVNIDYTLDNMINELKLRIKKQGNIKLMFAPIETIEEGIFSLEDLERATENEMNNPCESKKYLYR